ncbi:dihydroxy-acid dehydratase, chloroplastic-like [Phalaenopsis equestris]|uniref:dihydroxy-acid dehydratase, chloroplastic-like n=1 Tax=Phalaenopsis equestris TaxID=78828 RepID=UPI0009E613BA|nr:dihydroxy-acid dehydratase, chloroplastic-like [Phalaenopsis equestris]
MLSLTLTAPFISTTRSPYTLPRRPLLIRARTQEIETPQPPPKSDLLPKLNRYSSRITEPKSQGGSQAVLYGVGLSDNDMKKPQVGISSVWYEGNTCNMHLMQLAAAVKDGVREAGMFPFRFNTIGVSDAISMGTRGMCYSLQSRDLIADSIESVMAAQWYDANISIPGCDKNMSGTIMAMGRLNRPSLMIYGGTIKPGITMEKHLIYGLITDDDRMTVLRNYNSCPGAGACGGMYAANTMASAIETMGMTLPYRSVGLHLTLDDFQKVSDAVPFLADLKPSSKYVMEDLHKIGGTPAVIRYLLEEGFLDGDCITVTGKTLEENMKFVPSLAEGQQIIRPVGNPIKASGHIQILYGNLAPDGSVAKITGKEGLYFFGPALVFEGEESMIAAISENPMNFKGKVVVKRGEGPKGGPGMECALLTDGRFSGGSHGFVVGHICPEAQDGGPIGLIQNGDVITIDINKRRIDVQLSDEQLTERSRKWSPPPYKATRGVLYKYIKSVQSASRGCVTDE